MRDARVATNLTCNQNCAFCNARRAVEDPRVVTGARRRIERVAEAGVERIVLTGGEPTLRRDLEKLVTACRSLGIPQVIIETNATLIDAARAEALAAAGLDVARIHLPAWGDRAERITRDPGGFSAALAGARALLDAGIELEVSLPVVRSNLVDIAEIPEKLAESGLEVGAIVLRVPTDSPDPSELVRLDEASRAIESVAASARRWGLSVRFDPDAEIPPCAFAKPGRVAHLYALSRGGSEREGFMRIDACAECAVADRCPGMRKELVEREPDLGARLGPIREDRLRRRLSVIAGIPEQIERELVSREVCRRPDGSVLYVHTVRINFQCNQACQFCFVSTHLPAADDERVRSAIVEAGSARAILALSGGEPTLNPRLEEFARLGKASGVREIELQTNATRLGEPGRAEALFEAGVDVAFVSLHGSCSEISDAVTAAPGTFDATLCGIDAIYRSPLQLRINFVFCELNRRDFVNVVRLIGTRWPKAKLSVSFVAASTDLVPRERWLVPRYTDIMPELSRGLELARELGVWLTGFESMCGLPLCQIPTGAEAYFSFPPIPKDADHGEFIKPEVCSSCAGSDRCFGVRRGYAELWGTAELVPLSS